MQDMVGSFSIPSNEANINPSNSTQPESLRTFTERVLKNYFAQLGNDVVPTDLHNLVLKEVEVPLLQVVLQQTRGNQTKAAQLLGWSRGTLRKKLKQYQLD